MVRPVENNFAFIDSQNLNLAIRSLGWKLDFKKFRVYLKDKYHVTKAFLFIGYIPNKQFLYSYLQQSGYICIFKPTMRLPNGVVKGNVDAELVLHTMIQYPNFDRALVVTGDGDFYCLVEYLLQKSKLLKVMIPNQNRYSGLFKKLSTEENNILTFISQLKDKLNEKSSHQDKTFRELFPS